MQENTSLLEDKISQMQTNVDRAAASSHTLDTLVEDWPADRSRVEKLRDKLFGRWRSILASCQINYAPLNRLNGSISKSNLFTASIPVHPNVVRAKAYIAMLTLRATLLQILVLILRIMVISIVIIVICGLVFGLFLLIKLMFENVSYFVTHVLPGLIP